jgi:4-diphosphocytidyl-2-C-methyl-D-erythritol kinase
VTITVPCPAKINEFLAVGARDERGYHPIRSIFQEVSLSDQLSLSSDTGKDQFVCNWELPDRNTVTKTWSLVKEFLFLPPLRIELTKNIPAESGLGGGSSDAAGLLKVIDRFASTRLSETDKHEIARAVGADVPFFLLGGRAMVKGYGEQLTPLPDIPTRWIVIARPDVSCPTKEMYGKLDCLEPFPFLEVARNGEVYNDFERVAPPECLKLIDTLRSLGAEMSGLTGSGSAVYGYFADEQAATSAHAGLVESGTFWAAVAHTMPRGA